MNQLITSQRLWWKGKLGNADPEIQRCAEIYKLHLSNRQRARCHRHWILGGVVDICPMVTTTFTGFLRNDDSSLKPKRNPRFGPPTLAIATTIFRAELHLWAPNLYKVPVAGRRRSVGPGEPAVSSKQRGPHPSWSSRDRDRQPLLRGALNFLL